MEIKSTLKAMLPLLLAIVVGAIVLGAIKKSPLGEKLGLADELPEEEFQGMDDFQGVDNFESFANFENSGSYEEYLKGSPLEHYAEQNPLIAAGNSGKSTFTLKVTRTGITDSELPVSLFGPLDAMTAYNRTITSGLVDFNLGAIGGFTLLEAAPNTQAVKTYANRNSANFLYANDTIQVTSQSAIGYPAFVQSLLSNSVLVRGFRMTVSNTTTGLNQFGNTITVRDESLFGAIKENSITPEADKNPQQFQSNITDIPKAFLLSGTTTFNFDFIQLAQTVTFTFFVEAVQKQLKA